MNVYIVRLNHQYQGLMQTEGDPIVVKSCLKVFHHLTSQNAIYMYTIL